MFFRGMEPLTMHGIFIRSPTPLYVRYTILLTSGSQLLPPETTWHGQGSVLHPSQAPERGAAETAPALVT